MFRVDDEMLVSAAQGMQAVPEQLFEMMERVKSTRPSVQAAGSPEAVAACDGLLHRFECVLDESAGSAQSLVSALLAAARAYATADEAVVRFET